MGFLSKFFPQTPRQDLSRYQSGYKTFTEWQPAFNTWSGSLYEQALTRACVERYATACSKLKPEVLGSDNCKPSVRKLFETWPNDSMSWPTFLKRVATLLETDTTAYVIPSEENGRITGLHPMKPDYAEVCEYHGRPWMIFHLATGDVLPIEFEKVAILTKFQYQSDVFGGGNGALDATLTLMDAQRQAEELALKNGARIRFIGKVTGLVKEGDLEKKRDRFATMNLSHQNSSGLLVYDNTFDSVKQVDERQYTIDTDEMERIDKSVYSYFGINERILTNQFTEEEWGAYYESKVEPFAIMLSEALTKVLYTAVERRHGNYVMFSSNRLEYASNASKRNMVRDMVDRGVMNINEAREVLQLPPIEGGDVFFARGEYKDAQGIGQQGSPVLEEDRDLGGDDDIYNDTDGRGEEDKFDG